MPNIQFPPYTDKPDSERWKAWFRLLNKLVSDVSTSLDNIDDVNITGVTDQELLIYDSASAKWINATGTEWGIVNDTTPQLGGDLDGQGTAAITNITTLAVGVDGVAPAATALIETGDSGQSAVHSAGDDLVINVDTSGGSTLLVPDSAWGTHYFGSPTTNIGAWIAFRYSSRTMNLGTNAASGVIEFVSGLNVKGMQLDSNQDLQLGTTTAQSRITVEDSARWLMWLESTDSSASSGPIFYLMKDSSSPASNDDLGQMIFNGRNSAAAIKTYASMLGHITTVTAGAEDGRFDFTTLVAGSATTRFHIGAGCHTGNATDNGMNTITAHDLHAETAVYLNGAKQIGAATSVTAASHTHAVTERWLVCDASSNAITVNLVAAATAGNGARLDVKVIDATNAVTIDANSTETIDGSLTAVITTQYDSIALLCDGSNWHIT